ncbi:uncharacterized protein DUF3618 [Yoonia maricola]|uniref:Uncharacterized protein DUF3618 n=1 Tax=Yoonia maricola TaxID=420999 RepID=A0A2M8W0L2_9RHOB|nr:DUF3618 domain-containing protein [Yoonia maricola]PJI84460.1 uncharacterized protein DUF3618 [Yoonia maricola]
MSDIKHISQRVEADRAQLASSLDALTDTVQPQKLAHDFTAAANDIGRDLAQKAWGTLRDNPAGGLLVTIGLGLLASGQQRRPAPSVRPTSVAVEPDAAMTGFDARVAEADAQLRAEMTGEMEQRPEASRLKAALNTGLDQLSPQARQRVVKARQAVVSAQETIERKSRKAVRKTKGFAYEQPLAAGALALGFGVLAGTLLPGTRREDALLGRRRDALMADARNALEEEMLKAKVKAESTIANKTGVDVGERRA